MPAAKPRYRIGKAAALSGVNTASLRAGCDGSGPQCRIMQALHDRAEQLPHEEAKSRAHRHV